MTWLTTEDLKDNAYARKDPQYHNDEPTEAERAEGMTTALYKLADIINAARGTIDDCRATWNTRCLNNADRLLSEAEDQVDDLLERGCY